MKIKIVRVVQWPDIYKLYIRKGLTWNYQAMGGREELLEYISRLLGPVEWVYDLSQIRSDDLETLIPKEDQDGQR